MTTTCELKSNLLQPMLDHLDNHVLPVLEHKVGNVGIQSRLVPVPKAGLTEMAVTTDNSFCYHETNERPDEAGEDAAVPAFLASPLAHDARQRHFQALLRDWDALLDQFQDYNAACIRNVDGLRSEIMQAGILPVLQLPMTSDDRWIDLTQLAMVLFYRQLGLAIHPFVHRTGRTPQVLEYMSRHLAHGKLEEISQYMPILETLNAQRDGIDKLTEQAQSVREGALRVRTSLEDHLLRRRLRRPWLRNRCPYM